MVEGKPDIKNNEYDHRMSVKALNKGDDNQRKPIDRAKQGTLSKDYES